ncbi:CPBP family intramembrane metalloprotease [Lachnotalea glycerini]|uniref:CPBP family intramembrane metalloprotease n=1 Tax=Lachnotalea glycerini TaxID=1763509 RepID=A0A371JD95_9FIRM|nr:CPBP family intramembrane metalloprotease [Lachnotalea glycerini]
MKDGGKEVKKENIFIKLWKVIYPVGIYFLITNVVTFVFMAVAAFLMGIKMVNSGEVVSNVRMQEKVITLFYRNSMMLTALSGAITIPIIYILFKKDRTKENVQYEKGSVGLYGFIFIAAASACLGCNQLLSITKLDEIFPGFLKVQEVLYGGNIVMEILAAVILAPIIEELLFRGMVFKRLYVYVGKMPAMLLSSLFFGIYHGNVLQGIYAFSVGLLFVFIYDKYKTLLAPILAHMFANLVSILSVETGIFDFLYVNNLNIYLSTVIEIIICIVMVIVIQTKVFRTEKAKEEKEIESFQ